MQPTRHASQEYQGLRPYLFTVAYRLTGSASEAEDLIHEAWIRYLDAGSPSVKSLQAYLTTIVSRLSLDYLKSARVRREHYVGSWLPEPIHTPVADADPAETAERRESLSMALLTLLDRLTPEQRVVYVLRESLGVPYDEIGELLGKSSAASRQLYRRAATRLEQDSMPVAHGDRDASLDSLVPALIDALEAGDVAMLASLLHRDAVWISDAGPERLAARKPIHGAGRIARGLVGITNRFFRKGPMQLTIEETNSSPSILVWENGQLSTVLQIATDGERITDLWFSRNLVKLAHLADSLEHDPVVVIPDSLPCP